MAVLHAFIYPFMNLGVTTDLPPSPAFPPPMPWIDIVYFCSPHVLWTAEGAIEKANALQAAQEELRSGETVPDIAPIQKVSMFGTMAIFASKVAAGSRLPRDKCEEASEIVLMGERSAAAAMGAKHTEEQLLRANRSVSFMNHARPF